uniref:Phosphatidate phosphatase APP1 catalytic domain-containing protein n=1 Tax=Timspurckia oligopyrenoides TaxID=708627 RepID=A0A7S0ZBS6_9RHOD|mmetsp:Transcript_11644/g.21082  ORF Transcript_11644/g.21082 Transcript_11644/m.21082 type:complete len:537 (+) Transcript_11644:539-2149(+)
MYFASHSGSVAANTSSSLVGSRILRVKKCKRANSHNTSGDERKIRFLTSERRYERQYSFVSSSGLVSDGLLLSSSLIKQCKAICLQNPQWNTLGSTNSFFVNSKRAKVYFYPRQSSFLSNAPSKQFSTFSQIIAKAWNNETPSPTPQNSITNHSSISPSSSSTFVSEKPTHLIQVITDIDDTVKCSGGIRFAGVPLGGIDTRYARGEFYPGVFQFLFELSVSGLSENSESNGELVKASEKYLQNAGLVLKDAPLPVAVLTARAREFKFALKIRKRSALGAMLSQVGENAGYSEWGLGPVLYGSVVEWICTTRKGKRKFQNFERLMRRQKTQFRNQNKSISYVYVGDTGEMDADAGERMAAQYPNLIRAVFLHSVGEDDYLDTRLYGVPVRYFRTYVGAARKALECGLLDANAVHRIMEQTERDALAQAEAAMLYEQTKRLVVVRTKENSSQLEVTEQPELLDYPEFRTVKAIYEKHVSLQFVSRRLEELEYDFAKTYERLERITGNKHVKPFSAKAIVEQAKQNVERKLDSSGPSP